jgi:hypothetical protein
MYNVIQQVSTLSKALSDAVVEEGAVHEGKNKRKKTEKEMECGKKKCRKEKTARYTVRQKNMY